MKKAIIITLIVSLFLMISCACPKPKQTPMTNMPPEPELPKPPKTVSPLPDIVSMDEMTLVGYEKDFDGETMAEIPSMWMTLMQSVDEIKNRANDTEAWGSSYNMNYGGDSFTFTYFAGYEVTDATDVPEGMVVHVVPASKYAKFAHYGSLDGLSQTYSYIYGGWMPQSGYEQGPGDELELYNEDFNHTGLNSTMYIFVPIQ